MMHKKLEHAESCKRCEKYVLNECTREETCWYPHIMDQGFHTNQLIRTPPIVPGQKTMLHTLRV